MSTSNPDDADALARAFDKQSPPLTEFQVAVKNAHAGRDPDIDAVIRALTDEGIAWTIGSSYTTVHNGFLPPSYEQALFSVTLAFDRKHIDPNERVVITVTDTSQKLAINESLIRCELLRLVIQRAAILLMAARCPECAAKFTVASIQTGHLRCAECPWPDTKTSDHA